MHTLRTKAIVLRRTNYGEADRIIQLLTPERKISVLARSVRKNGSKLAGALEPFSLSDVTIALGRGELGTITSARLEIFYSGILQEYPRLQLGYEIVKEISRIAEDIDEPECFALLKTALESLHDTHISISIIRVWFGLQLLELQGQGINLVSDAQGQPLEAEKRYGYSTHERTFFEASAGHYGVEEIKFLRLAQANPPVVLARIVVSPKLLDVAGQLI